MSELGEERLARRAARGDTRAFEQIYERYNQQLYRFCLAMLGNPHDAQDALQNTMVKVLRALPGEKRQIKLKPWLYRIARNEAVEMLRRRRDRLDPEPEQTAPTSSQIAERAEDRDRLRMLLNDLEALPDRQRGALVMRELSGLSFEEIARAFETSPATARQTVYEARLGLRQMEAGREMRCETVTRALSDADGRLRRRRDLRAHLRQCPTCRAFAEDIGERRSELAALAPLPLAASAGILHGVLAGQAQGSAAAVGGAAAGAAGPATAGKAIATSALAKSAATVAVVAVAGVSAVDRSGLIDVGLPGHRGGSAKSAPAATSAGTTGRAAEGAGAAVRASGLKSSKSVLRIERRHAAGHSSHAGAAPGAARGGAPRSSGQPAGDTGVPAANGQPGSGAVHGSNGHRNGAASGSHSGSGPSAASAHGQATAAAHKSPQANPSPGGGSRGHGGSAGSNGSAEHSAHRAGAPSPPAQASPPPAKESAPGAERGSAAADSSSGAQHTPDGEGQDPFHR